MCMRMYLLVLPWRRLLVVCEEEYWEVYGQGKCRGELLSIDSRSAGPTCKIYAFGRGCPPVSRARELPSGVVVG